MFPHPWGFLFGMGERRRRRRSSESSRSRDRRRRSDRGRSRRSRTPERSERSQPSSLPPPPAPPVPPMVSLPVPSPGFVWQQVPVAPTNVHAGTATQSLPQHVPVQSWNQKDQSGRRGGTAHSGQSSLGISGRRSLALGASRIPPIISRRRLPRRLKLRSRKRRRRRTAKWPLKRNLMMVSTCRPSGILLKRLPRVTPTDRGQLRSL